MRRSETAATINRMTILRFHILPNAKQNNVMGEHGSAIKIKLRAPAVEGRANAALCSFLAERLNIPERMIVLQRGQKSRDKIIQIESLSEEDVRSRLLPREGRALSRPKNS